MALKEEVELLRRVPMFSKLEPAKLKLLAFTSESLDFDDGEVLFVAGDGPDAAYVVVDGTVEILASTDAGDFVSGELRRNDLFGELGVLTNSPRAATLRARGHLVAMRIGAEVFMQVVAENSEVALAVMAQLSAKLAKAHRQYEELRGQVVTDGGG